MVAVYARAVRFVLVVSAGLQSAIPVGPSFGCDWFLNVRVIESDCRIIAPRTPKYDLVSVVLAGDFAVQKIIARVLGREVLALCGKHYSWIVSRVQLAMIEDCLRIAEDEIYVAFNVAIAEVLTRSLARRCVCRWRGSIPRQVFVARSAIGVQGILCAQQSYLVYHGTVGTHQQSDSLGPFFSACVLVLPSVFDGQVFGFEAVGVDGHGTRFAGSSCAYRCIIPTQHDVLRLSAGADEYDVWLVDVDFLAVCARREANHFACRRRVIDGFLQGTEVRRPLVRNR